MYDLEPWKRPTGLIEEVSDTPPREDTRPAPGAPTRDTDRVSLEIHRLEAEHHRLVVDPAHAPNGGWQYNPSLVVHNGRLYASVRLYLDGSRRENVIGEVADDWTLTNQRTLRSRALEPRFKWLPGYEDLRLFRLNDGVHAIASVCARTHDGRFRAVAAVLDLDDALTTIESAHYQESRYAEKNWMPLATAEGVRFVYQTEPHTIVLRYDERLHTVDPVPPGAGGMIRGGSQLLPLPDGRYLACVHENRAPAGHAIGRYVHRFVLFDRFLQFERKSEMFVFKETGIEFCAGMALWRDKLVLSYGLQDKQAWLAVTDLATVLRTVGVGIEVARGCGRSDCATCHPEVPHPMSNCRPTYTLHTSTAGDRLSCVSCGSPLGGCPDSCACKCGSYEPRKQEVRMYDLEPWKAPPNAPLPGRLPDGAAPQRAPSVVTTPSGPAIRAIARTQSGPSEDIMFTTVIPGLLGWCSDTKARRLAELVEHRNARTVVEIGVFGGRSLLALGVGARRVGAQVAGIDPYTAAASLEGKNSRENDAWWSGVDYEDVYKRASAAAVLLPGVSVVRAKSLDVAVTYEPGSVDVIHIDGNHSEETSCADVRAWLPKLSLGAIIVMDDIAWETTRKAQAMLAEAGCECLEQHIREGESWAIYQCIGARLKAWLAT